MFSNKPKRLKSKKSKRNPPVTVKPVKKTLMKTVKKSVKKVASGKSVPSRIIVGKKSIQQEIDIAMLALKIQEEKNRKLRKASNNVGRK
jgi:hypothetical protein